MTVLWATLACACSALVQSPAQAQDEIDEAPASTLQDHSERERLGPKKTDAKARDLFEKGRAAWDEGRFREAWEYWHHSYRLSRRPELLYNVGQAADRLRMDREALEAFRLYLEKNPDAANRKEVENRIRILEREVEGNKQERTDYLDEGLSDDAATTTVSTGAGEGEDAAPPSEDYKGEEPLDEPEDVNGGKRTDLYVRLEGGFGLWAASVSDNAGQSGSLSSLTFVLDGLVGWGVMPELAVGGGLLIELALSPSFDGAGGSGSSDAQVSLAMLVGFADYYLDPNGPWHIFGGLGFGRVAVSGSGLGNEDAGGGALFAGAGYDIPIDDEIVFGLSARLLVGRFSNDTTDFSLFAPSLTASVLWF